MLFDVVKLEMYWKMIEIPDVCFVIEVCCTYFCLLK